MRKTRLLPVLVLVIALGLAGGAYAALAANGSASHSANVVARQDGGEEPEVTAEAEDDEDDGQDGDVDDDAGEADRDGEADGDGNGPSPDRGCANGSLDHAREVLTALLAREHPGENKGIRNALDKMCHGFFASADAAQESDDGDQDGEGKPRNGHAFGRGHGTGKPEGVPDSGGD